MSLAFFKIEKPSRKGGFAPFLQRCSEAIERVNKAVAQEGQRLSDLAATYSNTVEDNERWTSTAVASKVAYREVRTHITEYFAWLDKEKKKQEAKTGDRTAEEEAE